MGTLGVVIVLIFISLNLSNIEKDLNEIVKELRKRKWGKMTREEAIKILK